MLVIKDCLDFGGTDGNDEPGVNTEVTKWQWDKEPYFGSVGVSWHGQYQGLRDGGTEYI